MLIVPCLLAALCLINPAIAVEGDFDFNDPFVSYSADMLIEGDQGTTTSRVFHARGMDRLVQEGMALEPTVILRRDKKSCSPPLKIPFKFATTNGGLYPPYEATLTEKEVLRVIEERTRRELTENT